MLQHEPEQPLGTPAAPTPAAQIRVTSEELAQAINALEASRDEAARNLAGTVPIGEVVQELKLEATPEEIWAQVQKQRAQAAEEEARRVRAAAVPVTPAVQDSRAVRQRARGWRRVARGWSGIKGWLWIAFWCSGGLGLVSSALHSALHHSRSNVPSITVNGDHQTQTYNADGKDVQINGDYCTITVHGSPSGVTVNGDDDTVVTDTAQAARNIETNGDNDKVRWAGGPAPGVTGKGHADTSKP